MLLFIIVVRHIKVVRFINGKFIFFFFFVNNRLKQCKLRRLLCRFKFSVAAEQKNAFIQKYAGVFSLKIEIIIIRCGYAIAI